MQPRLIISAATLSLLLAACSDWNDMGTETIPSKSNSEQQDAIGIAFTASVNSINLTSRADKTIVNKDETTLLPTETSEKKVGLFGCYTGQHTWAELIGLSQMTDSEIDALTEEEKTARTETLNEFYTANQMFNIPATIEADGSLTYLPLQFWPNNVLTSGAEAGQHEYMTFWAYYPYNSTSSLGEYGISMTSDEDGTGVGKGMGKVKFTMHADAAQQNDFLISAPVADCNRDKYPLLRTDDTPSYAPKPVQFHLYHMLAQVRFYVFIRGDDKMVYKDDNADGIDDIADGAWFDAQALNATIIDAYGNVFTKVYKNGTDDTEGYVMEQTSRKKNLTSEEITAYGCGDLSKEDFVALGLKVPNESQCVRWDRTTHEIWDLSHARRRADINYELQINNIHTTATFYPRYSISGASIDYTDATVLGSATVNNYIMNPYWFTFNAQGQRVRLNDNYMFGFFEDTPAANQLDATGSMPGYDDVDGMDWSGTNDVLSYLRLKTTEEKAEIAGLGTNSDKHYNYPEGNILMVVPQVLYDDDVPHVIITAKGRQVTWDSTNSEWVRGSEQTAKVTINMLKMGISWESGYIYCYAFLDDLKPGDDKVRGPESITTIFNKEWNTDQW